MVVFKIKKNMRDTLQEQVQYLYAKMDDVWKLVRHRMSPNPCFFYCYINFDNKYKEYFYVIVHITPSELPPILEVQVPIKVLEAKQIEKLIFKMNAYREGAYLIYKRKAPFKHPMREFGRIFLEKIEDRFPEREIFRD